MFSKNKAKFIKSLQIKKFRNEYKNFLVEGAKSTLELIHSDFIIEDLFVSEQFLSEHKSDLQNRQLNYEVIKESDLSAISSFTTNNAAIAVVKMKENTPLTIHKNEWALGLDSIKDPGNLGTIIRIADWYGIKKIICSYSTVDVYNPKVISATMGSFTRVLCCYGDLEEYIKNLTIPILGADLDGENAHHMTFPKGGLLVLGNESDGLSEAIKKNLTNKVHIPKYGGAESLNVAVATAILCDNIKRTS